MTALELYFWLLSAWFAIWLLVCALLCRSKYIYSNTRCIMEDRKEGKDVQSLLEFSSFQMCAAYMVFLREIYLKEAS